MIAGVELRLFGALLFGGFGPLYGRATTTCSGRRGGCGSGGLLASSGIRGPLGVCGGGLLGLVTAAIAASGACAPRIGAGRRGLARWGGGRRGRGGGRGRRRGRLVWKWRVWVVEVIGVGVVMMAAMAWGCKGEVWHLGAVAWGSGFGCGRRRRGGGGGGRGGARSNGLHVHALNQPQAGYANPRTTATGASAGLPTQRRRTSGAAPCGRSRRADRAGASSSSWRRRQRRHENPTTVLGRSSGWSRSRSSTTTATAGTTGRGCSTSRWSSGRTSTHCGRRSSSSCALRLR